VIPEEYHSDRLLSKGFFDEITVQDFPLRGKAVYLHIRRRRWLNQTTGAVVFRDWNMVAQGTRMTTEFASFLKAISGYTKPISCSRLGDFYQVNGKQLEEQYRDHLSDFNEWEQLDHANDWILFEENLGTHLSLDETALSQGKLYTVICNIRSI